MEHPRTKAVVLAVALLFASWTAVEGGAAAPIPATTAAMLPQATYGPVLEEFGPVYYMGPVDLATPLDRDYKAVFDVADAVADNSARSPAIETVARFLNLHAQAGVPRERLGAALVLHGGAAKYALSHEAYRERYSVDNPNLDLLEALRGVGVRIVICGQTVAARGFSADELAAAVGMALSAMTANKLFQDEGYQIVSF